MGFMDSLRGSSSESDQQEQLAADDPAPRGEERNTGWIVSTFGGGGGWFGSSSSGTTTINDDNDDDLETVRSSPPADMVDDHNDYFKQSEFPRAALRIFALIVTEPGYHISATVEQQTDQTDDDGNPITERVDDDEMQDALREWASQCAIDACEPGKDLSVLLKQAPILRYSKGTGFLEKAGTESDPEAIAALVYHRPETFVQYKQANKSLLVQPDDRVGEDHPRTPDGRAAAYVQYDDALSSFDDDSVAFAANDLVKLTFDAENGSAWGTSIWEACGDRIDALYQKLQDRDASIRTVGHAHRIYSSENWSQADAQEYASAHKEGKVSAGPNVGDHSNDRDAYSESWPGRVDFVSDEVNVQVASGEVADIDDAVKDDIEAIFSVLPLSKPKIAYASDINQYVIDPLDETDKLLWSDERQYLENTFGPIIEEKADELAGGSYSGEVEFTVEPAEDDNPLARESFPAENLNALTSSIKELLNSGADPQLIDAVLSHAGVDRAEVEEEFGDRTQMEPLDEEDEQVQEQFEQQQDIGAEADD